MSNRRTWVHMVDLVRCEANLHNSGFSILDGLSDPLEASQNWLIRLSIRHKIIDISLERISFYVMQIILGQDGLVDD